MNKEKSLPRFNFEQVSFSIAFALQGSVVSFCFAWVENLGLNLDIVKCDRNDVGKPVQKMTPSRKDPF